MGWNRGILDFSFNHPFPGRNRKISLGQFLDNVYWIFFFFFFYWHRSFLFLVVSGFCNCIAFWGSLFI
jgi:hypothetical protein